MKRIVTAAVAALALWGCGPDDDALPVGASAQAMVIAEEPPPPITDEPKRLTNEELFQDSAPLVTSPEDRTLADREHYRVDVQPPCR